MLKAFADWLSPIDVHRFRRLSFDAFVEGAVHPRKLKRALEFADRFATNTHPDAFLAYNALAIGLRRLGIPVKEFEVRLKQMGNLTYALNGKCKTAKLQEACAELNAFINPGLGFFRGRALTQFNLRLDEFFEEELASICQYFNTIDRNADFHYNFREMKKYWDSFLATADDIRYSGPGMPNNIMQQIFRSLEQRE